MESTFGIVTKTDGNEIEGEVTKWKERERGKSEKSSDCYSRLVLQSCNEPFWMCSSRGMSLFLSFMFHVSFSSFFDQLGNDKDRERRVIFTRVEHLYKLCERKCNQEKECSDTIKFVSIHEKWIGIVNHLQVLKTGNGHWSTDCMIIFIEIIQFFSR